MAISLTPGFSPVLAGDADETVLTVLPQVSKPLKRLASWCFRRHPAEAGCYSESTSFPF
jgi:hypothetical protein